METVIATIALTFTPLMLTVVVHYEALSGLSKVLQKSTIQSHPKVLVVVFGVITAHFVEIAIYALAYWIADTGLNIGDFGGNRAVNFADYLFFSAETFSTLGIGDIFPLGMMRLIASLESLNGIVLIGWSTSFTYLSMSRYWAGNSLE
ncbi:ion channel [Microvirga sp. 2MCAF35]|uniref:ion channel n=1 Tax=Microvirga sp. 2MCAF35 TaxID=3232987 RepID=UPI003F9E53C9